MPKFLRPSAMQHVACSMTTAVKDFWSTRPTLRASLSQFYPLMALDNKGGETCLTIPDMATIIREFINEGFHERKISAGIADGFFGCEEGGGDGAGAEWGIAAACAVLGAKVISSARKTSQA